MTPEHKASVLAHVLWMAERDPEYALAAAAWYERNESRLLANMEKLVKREVHRCMTCWPTKPWSPSE